APALPHLVLAAKPQYAGPDQPPVAPEELQQRERCPEMEHHHEGQELGRALVDRGAEEGRDDHGMAEAAHRAELRRTLENGDGYGLEQVQGLSLLHVREFGDGTRPLWQCYGSGAPGRSAALLPALDAGAAPVPI